MKAKLCPVDLEVDKIHDVQWDKRAFENLVIEKETKHLVQCLVSSRIAAENSTDLIQGKGNGLIMLLHGYDISISVQDIVEGLQMAIADQGLEKHLQLVNSVLTFPCYQTDFILREVLLVTIVVILEMN